MTHTYLIEFINDEGQIVGEEFTTETSRPSKVVKKLDEAFHKKYGKHLIELENFNLWNKNGKVY